MRADRLGSLETDYPGIFLYRKRRMIMEMLSLEKELSNNSYPGRGIILGRSANGTKAVAAYFIMGRSENSRNRIVCYRRRGNPHGGL